MTVSRKMLDRRPEIGVSLVAAAAYLYFPVEDRILIRCSSLMSLEIVDCDLLIIIPYYEKNTQGICHEWVEIFFPAFFYHTIVISWLQTYVCMLY